MLWGGAVNPDWDHGEDVDSAFTQLRRDSGRRLDIAHYYQGGDDLFPDEAQLARHRGRDGAPLFYFNWKVAPELTWRAVASGAADDRIAREAAHLRKTLTDPFFLTISHEPEAYISEDTSSGNTVQDYDAMFRHVVEQLRAGGVGNAVTVMSYRGNAAYSTRSWWDQLWPGDDVVDWIAFDPYVFDTPGFDQDFPEALNRTENGRPGWPGFYEWARETHPGKPIMLGEWGIGQTFDDATVVDKLESMRHALPRLEDLKALVYWDIPRGPKEIGTRMDNDVRRKAFAKLARSGEVVGFRK